MHLCYFQWWLAQRDNSEMMSLRSNLCEKGSYQDEEGQANYETRMEGKIKTGWSYVYERKLQR